ncbi:hypothetical protein, partial [Schaedlerella arabinosiphila]|uniref:hypothetical protein n=1 Tax=Schaedlerella arabinosiphila TaxID=2044587 RepID=UPI0025582B2F
MYFIASNAFFLIFSHQTNEKGLVTLFSEPSLGDGNNGGLHCLCNSIFYLQLSGLGNTIADEQERVGFQ